MAVQSKQVQLDPATAGSPSPSLEDAMVGVINTDIDPDGDQELVDYGSEASIRAASRPEASPSVELDFANSPEVDVSPSPAGTRRTVS